MSKRQFKTYEDLLVDPEDAEHPNKRPKETEHRAFKRIIASAAAGANIDHAARSGRESRLRDILLDLGEEDGPSSSAMPVSDVIQKGLVKFLFLLSYEDGVLALEASAAMEVWSRRTKYETIRALFAPSPKGAGYMRCALHSSTIVQKPRSQHHLQDIKVRDF